VPAILEPVSFTTGLAASTATTAIFALLVATASFKDAINSVSTTGGILIATGPEEDGQNLRWGAITAGFQPVS